MHKTLTTVITIMLMGMVCGAGNLSITKDGKAGAWIRLKKQSSAPEKLAAEELRDYVKKISGADLTISTKPEKDDKRLRIIIGSLEDAEISAPKNVLKSLKQAKKDEAFYIKSEDNTLYIIGKTPVAALNGVYTLLEMMGVRWFYPGDLGENVPQNTTIELPAIDSFQSPAMNRSGLNMVCASYNFVKEYTWLSRNKFRIGGQGLRVYPDKNAKRGEEFFDARAINRNRGGGGHCWMERAVPGKKYFKSHPEYFALVRGKRRWGPKLRMQRCFSNPEVKRLCKEFVLQATGNGGEFSLAAEDAIGNYCHCPECRKMGTFKDKFSTSNLYHRFFSEITDYVIEKNPKAKLMVSAYTEFREPPTATDIKYNPDNVVVDICTHQRCYVHTFDDPTCKGNVKQNAMYLGWRKICPNIRFYDYIQYAHSMYAPWEYVMVKDFKRFAKDGCAGWLDECPPPFAEYGSVWKKSMPYRRKYWFSRWQLYYALAKLSWNPELKLADILNDAYDKYYGPAAAPMKKYHAIRHKLWKQAPGHALYGGPVRTAFCLTVPGATEELDALLKKAETLAGDDDKISKRIAQDKYYLDEFWKKEAAERKKLFSVEKRIVPEKNTGKMAIDGELSEDTWLKARPINNFRVLFSKAKPVETTSVRVAYDKNNFYIGVIASDKKAWSKPKARITEHDGDVWTDDSVEIMIAPPGATDSIYYHIISNTRGVVYDAKCEAGVFDKSFDSQAEVKVRKTGKDYLYEFRIPVKTMGTTIAPRQVWGMHFVRGCTNLQPPKTGEASSVDGTLPHSPMNFRRAVIGKNLVKNGNLDHLEQMKLEEERKKKVTGRVKPVQWGFSGGRMIKRDNSNNYFARLKNGRIFQLLTGGIAQDALGQTEKERKIDIAFTASGSGTLYVDIYRYSDKSNEENTGYTRDFRETLNADKIKLTETAKRYEIKYTIAPNEWIALAFRNAGEADIDDITVFLVE